jgi:glycosyltransferase involved in cell wall biosynthesis
MELTFSFIIPVFDRPDEINELLESLSNQSDRVFEIVIVEDGSTVPCEHIIEKYKDRLDISYFYKAHEMPSIARNYGMEKAKGNYFIFVDSDCIIPPEYMETIKRELRKEYVDAFGGPDKADSSFTNIQKAINYAMTSFITTGGIRGGQKIDKFYPRSFNLGLSREIYENIGGYPITLMHPGEDMVLSIEIIKRGYKTRLIPEAYVFHKRRTSLKKFFRQVFGFGKVRFVMSKVYPETFKIFYLFPSIFLLGSLLLLILSFVTLTLLFLLPYGILIVAIFIDSLIKNRKVNVALLSIVGSFYQLYGYGSGYISSAWKKSILNKDEYGVFNNGFYHN